MECPVTINSIGARKGLGMPCNSWEYRGIRMDYAWIMHGFCRDYVWNVWLMYGTKMRKKQISKTYAKKNNSANTLPTNNYFCGPPATKTYLSRSWWLSWGLWIAFLSIRATPEPKMISQMASRPLKLNENPVLGFVHTNLSRTDSGSNRKTKTCKETPLAEN